MWIFIAHNILKKPLMRLVHLVLTQQRQLNLLGLELQLSRKLRYFTFWLRPS